MSNPVTIPTGYRPPALLADHPDVAAAVAALDDRVDEAKHADRHALDLRRQLAAIDGDRSLDAADAAARRAELTEAARIADNTRNSAARRAQHAHRRCNNTVAKVLRSDELRARRDAILAGTSDELPDTAEAMQAIRTVLLGLGHARKLAATVMTAERTATTSERVDYDDRSNGLPQDVEHLLATLTNTVEASQHRGLATHLARMITGEQPAGTTLLDPDRLDPDLTAEITSKLDPRLARAWRNGDDTPGQRTPRGGAA